MKNISPPVGGATRNVSPLVTNNVPPAPAPSSSFSFNGDSPQRCGGSRSSQSSTDDSDVCVTPGVSHGHGVLVGVQVRHALDGSGVDSSLGIITSNSKLESKDHSAITSKPKSDYSGVISKPNHSAITSKSNPSNIHIIVPSNPKCAHPDEDEIDMSFDMDALEKTMKMYD
jgi:hypothetical protein